MKKILQGAILPFTIFASGLLLLGCDQPEIPVQHQDSASIEAPAEHSDVKNPDHETDAPQNTAALKSGNMFYVIRDVADLQLRTGDFTEQLKQTQSELQQAVDSQDQQKLQHAAADLQQQLQGFNQALKSVNLKTQEISSIRDNVLQANMQILKSPFLNGQLDLSKIDFQKIQNQMGNIQNEMIKLAGMMMLETAGSESENKASS